MASLTPIAPEHSRLDGSSPTAFKDAGNAALKNGDDERAARMYTLGIDLILGDDEPATSSTSTSSTNTSASGTTKKVGEVKQADAAKKGALAGELKGEAKGETAPDTPVAAATTRTAAAWFRLDAESSGVLHALLSNRSHVMLKQGDVSAAAEDADRCCMAAPDFPKGHLRLLAALEARGDVPVTERRGACMRGLRACPGSKELQKARAALDAEAGPADSRAQEAADAM
jgi:hypothetical protein